jgi:hypothetical protein
VGKTGTFRAALVGAVLIGAVAVMGATGAYATGAYATGAYATGASSTGASSIGANTILLPCVLPIGGLPGHSGSIGNRQNGKTVCLTVGEKLLVSLSGPAQTRVQWQHIMVSPAGILRPLPVSIALARGVTAADFLAKTQGVVRLSSQRHVCPPATPGSASCDAIVSWSVTVTVNGPHRAAPQPVSPAA